MLLRMSTARKLIISLVLVVLAGVAAVAIYVVVQNSRAPEALSADTESSSDAFDPAALTGTWTVTDNSVAGYRVDEVLSGQDVTVVGRTTDVSGTVEIEGSAITSATLSVNLDSVETDNSNRDGQFRELLQTSEYPNAEFVLDETFKITEGTPAENNGVVFEVPGTLHVAGASAQVTASITATLAGEVTNLVGNIPIVFADFDVEAPSLGFVKVEEQGLVEFSLELTRD
jgi:polyisoprenoid-binding protein YceI